MYVIFLLLFCCCVPCSESSMRSEDSKMPATTITMYIGPLNWSVAVLKSISCAAQSVISHWQNTTLGVDRLIGYLEYECRVMNWLLFCRQTFLPCMYYLAFNWFSSSLPLSLLVPEKTTFALHVFDHINKYSEHYTNRDYNFTPMRTVLAQALCRSL